MSGLKKIITITNSYNVKGDTVLPDVSNHPSIAMKALVLSIMVLVLTGQPVAGAESSKRIQNLEDEINVLRQATSAQGEKIQSLESRVGSREVQSLTKEPGDSDADGKDGAGQASGNVNRGEDDFSSRYTD
ncbi:MAG: hypothetical protein ACYDBT_00280 [Desulfobulbaceae bacterium]